MRHLDSPLVLSMPEAPVPWRKTEATRRAEKYLK
jgi:hypothetical protein